MTPSPLPLIVPKFSILPSAPSRTTPSLPPPIEELFVIAPPSSSKMPSWPPLTAPSFSSVQAVDWPEIPSPLTTAPLATVTGLV
jgi:hypothetical protein